MRVKTLISAALSALTLSSCNGVPISTQWKLRSFDLDATDLATFRVALRAPEWAVPTPEKTVLLATLAPKDGKGDARSVELHAQRAVHAEDAGEIARLSQKGGGVAFYEVSARDLTTARALQAEAQRLKREGGGSDGKVSVERGVVCRRGATPEGPILVDLFVHPDDSTGWLPVFDGYDVRDLIKTPEDLRKFEEGAPLCDKHALRVETMR
jgi:hypothetical protein